MKKIYVFYPSKVVGGAEFLLKRTAEVLSDDFNVCIVDIKGGWLSDNIGDDYKGKIEVKKINGIIKLTKSDILITPANLIFNIDKYFTSEQAKVILWTMQPYNFVPSVSRLRLKKQRYIDISYILNNILSFYQRINMREFIKLSSEKKGIYSVDGECDNVLSNFYGVSHNNIIPVFVNNNHNNNLIKVPVKSEKIKVLWIGRIDIDFKIHILKKILIDLNDIGIEYNIEFNIVGSGPGIKGLDLFCENIKNITIKKYGTVNEKNLIDIIKENHIGFAMGTSALEMAINKLPTILLDFSYNEIKYKYKYKLVKDGYDFIVGKCIDDFSDEEKKRGYTLNEMFELILSQYENISFDCYNYVVNNHSKHLVKERLLLAIKNTELSLTDCINFASENRPFWRE